MKVRFFKNPVNKSLAALALFVAAGSVAHAAAYTKVETSASRLTFGYSQMNVGLQGNFNKLSPKVFSFDPAAPENAKVEIEVPLISVDSGNVEANAELVKPDWLATEAHPVASFVATKVTPQSEGSYQVDGNLTIKGVTKPVSMPVAFKEEDGKGVFDGGFTFKRTDFGVGEGPWGDTSIVADEVSIKFHVVAQP